MDCESAISPYYLLFQALALIPVSHYFLAAFFVFLVFLYNFLEIHFLHDLLTFFRGDPVTLTYNSSSDLGRSVAAKCKIFQQRYLVTPWLSSPHIQTAFLTFHGRPPPVTYRRHLFRAFDGGTIALDWLTYSDVLEGSDGVIDGSTARKDDKTPIVIVIPGLTSDSIAAYVKHLAFNMARQGWNVVVSNHRGLGGVSLTSDCCYNAGWTEDVRKVIDHIRCEYPEAPLYAVGTSIGANILVKYLGEDGANTPVVGAAAICSPWDLLVCDRFINRRPMQKIYDRALTVGLQGYAQLHQSILSRLVNWEGVEKSSSLRDFDNHATRILGKFETVDTYYRRSSSINYIENVSVPLLCVSAMDDPVCTSEAIPWDECRVNENIVLATTPHGGHLAYYEGITASGIWWVRAVNEFFGVLRTSPLIKRQRMQGSPVPKPLQSSIDRAPYLNVMGDGMVTAMSNEPTDALQEDTSNNEHMIHSKEEGTISDNRTNFESIDKINSDERIEQKVEKNVKDLIVPVQARIDKLSRRSRQSIWLLAYIAVITTWPFVGSIIVSVLKKRFKTFIPGTLLRK
ncbi:Alpha/beta-Hydrolases superfamily protein isoform 2 [Hibiscus syriacus]|uniref:Alpha/beta-Hydrolases superfamily protein isoform 2 n=1 Tax=Hibiscus syriacus TaxID=106335 RepID=A0A6A3A3F9_HIBSY|nr:embryogenesis-associated protein EMB8-like isoform X1 [Hibiscus syriacus]KAE8698824.1 Alpha/beta-Hydrolases superfamily protein isoform 2 [Hibiscus syriacus]